MTKRLQELPSLVNTGSAAYMLVKQSNGATEIDYKITVPNFLKDLVPRSMIGEGTNQIPVLEDDSMGRPALPPVSGENLTNLTIPTGNTGTGGLLKLSDSLTSSSNANSGVAATPYAVKQLNDNKFAKTGGNISGDVIVASNKTLVAGGSEIMDSSAVFQVNGFMRTGDVYIHEGGSSPTSDGVKLSNVSGELLWNDNKIWTDTNQGAGSGLDADTVDGLQASSFLRSDASDSYTGTLTINNGSFIKLAGQCGIKSSTGSRILYDHGNGNVTLSAASASGDLYLGYSVDTDYYTRNVRLESNLVNGSGTTIINTSGQIFDSGNRVYSSSNNNIGTGATNYAAGNHSHTGSDYFRSNRGSLGTTAADWNDNLSTGTYRRTFTGASRTTVVFNHTSGSARTVALTAAYSGQLYFATNTDGNRWMEHQIWTSATDGSGSGLDADTVDGQQATNLGVLNRLNAWSGTNTFIGTTKLGIKNTCNTMIKGGLAILDYVDESKSNGRMYYQNGIFEFRGGGVGEADATTGTSLRVRYNSTSIGTVWHSGNDDTLAKLNTGETYDQLLPSKGAWLRAPSSGFLPQSTGVGKVGNSSWRFDEMWATTFQGNLVGNASTASQATKVTVTNSTANTNYPVVWHNNANTLYDTASKFYFNPSSGIVTATKFESTGSSSGDFFYANANSGASWDTNNNTGLLVNATDSSKAYNILRVNTDNGFKLQTLGGTGGQQRWYTSGSNYITFSGTTITASLSGKATTAGTADNSLKLGGRSYSEGSTANTIVSRDGSGDISARLFRSTYANQTTISGGMCFRVNNGSDNYIRTCSSTSAIRTWLSTYSKAEVDAKLGAGWTIKWSGAEDALITLTGLEGKEVCFVSSDTDGNDEVAVSVHYIPVQPTGFSTDLKAYFPHSKAYVEYRYATSTFECIGDAGFRQVWYRTPATNAYPPIGTIKA